MSHLTYSNYKGWGEWAKDELHYSQAVRVGDRIECAGQGGWDPETREIPEDLEKQIEQAFRNVELNLKNAGGAGWSQVYLVRSYHVGFKPEQVSLFVEKLRRFCPDHRPVWTLLGVERLGIDAMRIEIDVVAHVPPASYPPSS